MYKKKPNAKPKMITHFNKTVLIVIYRSGKEFVLIYSGIGSR